MKACTLCQTTETVKWYTGPKCIKCYQAGRVRAPINNALYRKKHGEKLRAYEAGYRARPMAKQKQKNQYLLCTYGISLTEYEALSASQEHLCAICGKANDRKRDEGRLVVDHCHATGRIRGLLCHLCNVGLGSFKDNADALLLAINYLRKPSL